MKAKSLISLFALILFTAGTGFCADPNSTNPRPYMGVLLDPTPLPALLVKHLGLSPDQGIRIKNIHRNSPADKAGLERDDIIIGFNGKDVVDYEEFVNEIRNAGVGTEVSLEIIHLGQRKTVKLTLEALEGEFDLKYPPEPEIIQSWRPGKIFRLRPGDENWMEILKDSVPSDFDVNIKKFFNELYTYHHSDGEDYTITIEGDPNEEDSTITVQAGDNEFKSTLGKLDKLPEKYRESAEQDVKKARKNAKNKWFDNMEGRNFIFRDMPDDFKSYFDKIKPYRNFQVPPFEQGGPMFERIQKQMKELQQRLDKLEKRWEKKSDSEESGKKDSGDGQKNIHLEKDNLKKV